MINYYSTEGKYKNITFEQAIISGLAPDKGLYVPERFNQINKETYKKNNFIDMSFDLAKLFIEDAIPDNMLYSIVQDAFNFNVPLTYINENIYILELFWGPTAAFKDFGARFMSRVLSYFLKEKNKKVKIIVATSGDTGSAVAKGFFNIQNIDVIILYPKGKVSNLQEKQLTTLNNNIVALEVNGTFDDCQKIAKEAFIDKELNNKFFLSSANSINIGRLIPQSFYYVWGYILLNQIVKSEKVIFCTPSGNFGNLTGGLYAKKMGLPVEKFIASTNINDIIPEFLLTGVFSPRASILTYSNAMDVGNPSNFSRMIDLYQNKENMIKDIVGYKITDSETLDVIKEVYDKYKYILDPHTAVGFKATQKFIQDTNIKTPIIILGTAHPAKFSEIINKTLNINVPIPEVLQEALNKEKKSIEINADFSEFKNFMFNYFKE